MEKIEDRYDVLKNGKKGSAELVIIAKLPAKLITNRSRDYA